MFNGHWNLIDSAIYYPVWTRNVIIVYVTSFAYCPLILCYVICIQPCIEIIDDFLVCACTWSYGTVIGEWERAAKTPEERRQRDRDSHMRPLILSPTCTSPATLETHATTQCTHAHIVVSPARLQCTALASIMYPTYMLCTGCGIISSQSLGRLDYVGQSRRKRTCLCLKSFL